MNWPFKVLGFLAFMRVLIMNLLDAITYEPKNPTYAIRIFPSSYPRLEGVASMEEAIRKTPLKESPLYGKANCYVFDDVWHGYLGGLKHEDVLFTQDMAKQIIEDFQSDRKGCEDLLVHCTLGKNRSPAVAIALNELFNLGSDANSLKNEYPETNWYVYRVMMEVGQAARAR